MQNQHPSDHGRRDRQRPRSPTRVPQRVDSIRESYRDRDRRKEHSHSEQRGARNERDNYSGTPRSRSPYQDRNSYRRRSVSSSSSNGRKRRRQSYDDDRPRAKRRRSSPSPSRSPSPSPRRKGRRSPSPPRQRSKRSLSPTRHRNRSPPPSPKRREPYKRASRPLPSQQAAYTADPTSTSTTLAKASPAPEKQKPNFAPSGALAAETNTVAGTTIVLKYNEPAEARKPPTPQAWRLYVFKGPDTVDTLPLAERSCWLFGRERSVVDYAIEHPSCSKQHAVVQFRFVAKKNEFGDREGGVRPYVIDLDSANGTRVNGEKVPERRYVELMSGDVLVFGESTREYVLMLPPKE